MIDQNVMLHSCNLQKSITGNFNCFASILSLALLVSTHVNPVGFIRELHIKYTVEMAPPHMR